MGKIRLYISRIENRYEIRDSETEVLHAVCFDEAIADQIRVSIEEWLNYNLE